MTWRVSSARPYPKAFLNDNVEQLAGEVKAATEDAGSGGDGQGAGGTGAAGGTDVEAAGQKQSKKNAALMNFGRVPFPEVDELAVDPRSMGSYKKGSKVGRCRLTVSKLMLKGPVVSALEATI